uniref:YoaK family protein n=1 Tax=Marinobacter sp. OP 3.4 TaxID=3076501 RepID=UPI002E245368
KVGQFYWPKVGQNKWPLTGAFYLLSGGSFYGMFAASAACGLQNAMATQYSGAVVRTTHLTGIFTDLGIMLGAFLRGEGFDRRKALLFLIIISGFIAGGTLGAVLFEALRFKSLLVPGTVCLVLAGCYRLYSARYRQVSDQ